MSEPQAMPSTAPILQLVAAARRRLRWQGALNGLTTAAIVGSAIALWAGNSLLFTPGTTRSPTIIANAQLPAVGTQGSAANAMAFIALGLAIGLTWLRSRSSWGQAWRLTGQAAPVARALGINTNRMKILVMTASGGLAGLAAGNLVLGTITLLKKGSVAGSGFGGLQSHWWGDCSRWASSLQRWCSACFRSAAWRSPIWCPKSFPKCCKHW